MSPKFDALTMKQLIMDHYEYPRNYKLKIKDSDYRMIHMASDSCIDDIKLFVKFQENQLESISFEGKACTISTASTSMLTELVKGKSLEEINTILQNYEQMIALEAYDEQLLGEAVVFAGVGKQANRINCALLGMKALKQLLKDYEKERNAHV